MFTLVGTSKLNGGNSLEYLSDVLKSISQIPDNQRNLGISASKFVGSFAGLDIACIMRTLIGTCTLNGVNPRKYLSDVIGRFSRLPQYRILELLDNQEYEQLHDLLPWNWKPETDGTDE